MVNCCEKYTFIFFFIINICSDEKVIYNIGIMLLGGMFFIIVKNRR